MKFLSYKLWKERKASSPSRNFRSSLWKKLDNNFQDIYIQNSSWYQSRVFKYSMVSLVVLVVVASSGVGAYAYNSSEVTTGTKLYPIKQVIEKVEEKMKINNEEKAKFYLKQIARREAEKQVLERKSKKEVQIKQLEEKIKSNEEKLSEINERLTSSTLKTQIKERLEKRQVKIENKINKTEQKLETIKNKIEEKINQEEGGMSSSTSNRARSGKKTNPSKSNS